MILAIDIGNTSIAFAVMNGQKIRKFVSFLTNDKTVNVKARVRRILKTVHNNHLIEDVVVSSVVPKYLTVVEKECRQIFKKNVKVIGRELKVPIKNNYTKPRQVGQDRLVTAYAAKMLYGSPVIVIDFGTAITFDVVNRKGEYDGGIIVPGIRLSAESLFKKTAKLPQISTFKVPRSLVGKNTQDSILSGLFYGYGALCNGLIKDIKRTVKGRPKAVMTGGHTKVMKKFVAPNISAVDNYLVFKGISLVYTS